MPLMQEQPPTLERFIKTVLERTDCEKCKMPTGVPCRTIQKNVGAGYYAAICNSRARRAGFNHKINPNSLRLARHRN